MAREWFNLKLLGDKQLNKSLRKFANKYIIRINRSALGAATKPVLKSAKKNAKGLKYSGKAMVGRAEYAKSLKNKSSRYKKGHVYVHNIGAVSLPGGVRHGRKGPRNWANISHLIENKVRPHALGEGSKLTRRGKLPNPKDFQEGRKHPGLPANPHIIKAWNSNRGKLITIYVRQAKIKIAEFARIEKAKFKKIGR